MRFSIAKWRAMYDEVNTMGAILKSTQPDAEGNPPKNTISDATRRKMDKEIKKLLAKSDKYLDECRVLPKKPLWKYCRDNPETWLSSDKFEFFPIWVNDRVKNRAKSAY